MGVRMKPESIFIGILVLLNVIIGGLAIYQSFQFDAYQKHLLDQQNFKIKTGIQSLKMLAESDKIRNSNSSYGLEGIWNEDGFYCVRYNATNETDTIAHEKCHAFVSDNYYHFCEEYYK